MKIIFSCLIMFFCLMTWAQAPSAPQSVVATGINGGGYITFTAPATGTGITNYQFSTDNGINWNTPSPAVTSSPLTITGLTNCTTYQVKLRAVNGSGNGTASAAASLTPAVSTEPGITWTSRTSAATNSWRSVAYGNGMFVAVSVSGTGNRVMSSPDGITWTARSSTADFHWQSVTYGNGTFVAVSSNSTDVNRTVMTSTDGITWTARTAPQQQWVSVAFGNNLFVAVSVNGTGTRVMSSSDGINWTLRTSAVDNAWQSVTYGNGLFVAVSDDGTGNRVMTSTNGTSWTSRTSASDSTWRSVTYGNGLFVAVGFNGAIMTSPDGINWTLRTSAAYLSWRSITYGNGLFVSVAVNGIGNGVMTSTDGINWTSRNSAADDIWFGIIYGNGKFVSVANGGTGTRVMSSSLAVAPNTPQINSTTAGLASASVAFTTSLSTILDAPAISNIEYSTDNGISWTTPSPTVTTSPLLIGGLATGSYQVKIRPLNKVGTGCPSTASSVTIVPNNWIGGSGNWNIAGNWSGNAVPDGSTDITVSSGTPTLDVDFNIPSGKTLTLSGSASLTVAAGKTLTIAGTADFGGRPVTLKSTASGDAAIGQITGTLSNASQVTVERYVASNLRAWRLLSIPLSSSRSIRDQWAGTTANANAPTGETAGSGTLLTGHQLANGTAAAAAGFDWYTGLTSTSTSSIRFYSHNGSAGSFSSATNTPDVTATPAKQGYMVFVRGDRTVTSGSGTTTLRPSGTLLTGTRNVSISQAYEVVGNPYAATLDADQMYLNSGNSSVIQRNFWIWDATLGTAGGFRAISYGASSYAMTGGSGTATDYLKIRSGNAFFVQKNGSGGNLSIEENDKVDGSTAPVVLGHQEATEPEGMLTVNLLDTGRRILDGTALRFSTAFDASPLEAYDMAKLNNFNENLSLTRSGRYLSIESRPWPTASDTAFLAAWNLALGELILSIEARNMPQSPFDARLIDAFTGQSAAIDLTGGKIEIPFRITSDSASRSLSRFSIVFKGAARPSQAVITEETARLVPNPSSGGRIGLQLSNLPAGDYRVSLRSSTGALIARQRMEVKNPASQTTVSLDGNKSHLSHGTYFVTIEDTKGKTWTLKGWYQD